MRSNSTADKSPSHRPEDVDWTSGEAVLRYHAWYEKPPGSILASLEKKALHLLLPPLGRGSLLEVGCGTGYFAAWLADLGFAVVGVDRSPLMLEAARNRYPALPLFLGSAEALPFRDGSFDIVAFITSLEFMAHPQTALREGARVARRSILLGIINRLSPYALYRRWRGKAPYAQAHLYSKAEVQRLLASSVQRPYALAWTAAILSPRFGWSPSRLPGGGFMAMRIDLR